MVPKCSKRTHNSNEWKENIYFLFQDLFAFDMVLAWSVLNATIKKEEGPIHGWVCQSRKAFEVFLWVKPARPNWDQLGWAVPLQNIVLASVGPMVCCSHWYKSLLVVRPHQNFPRDLLRLNVARNSLNEVPSEALLQLKNLNQLDLSFNKIKYIEENTFAGKSCMRFQNVHTWLTAHHRQVSRKKTVLDSELVWLSGMDKLDTLNLNNNKIEELGPRVFGGNSS